MTHQCPPDRCKLPVQVFAPGFPLYWIQEVLALAQADLPRYDCMIPPNNLATIFSIHHSIKNAFISRKKKAHCAQFDQRHFSEPEIFSLCLIKRFQIET